jgi:hypothetical protein
MAWPTAVAWKSNCPSCVVPVAMIAGSAMYWATRPVSDWCRFQTAPASMFVTIARAPKKPRS